MKKKISIIVSFVFSVMFCSAQTENQFNDLINESIEKHISYKEKLIEGEVLTHNYLDNIVFLKDNFSENFRFSITTNHAITFFDESNFKKSDLKNGIRIFRLLPVVLTDNILSITIVEGLISKKRKNVTITSSESFSYRYKYSCDKKQWLLLNKR